MIVVADSGATKTDWLFYNNNIFEDCKLAIHESLSIRTLGINVATMGSDELSDIIDDAVCRAGHDIASKTDSIYFYGAGCINPESAKVLTETLVKKFPSAVRLETHSDMEGAAKALFGDGEGVAAIMGTGSNSCLWKNGKIVKNIRPGGFILGDEGSGACLGKLFLSDYFKDLVPEQFRQQADKAFNISYHDTVSKIYKGDSPSRYLASFAKFIVENKSCEYAKYIIEQNIRSFIERSLIRYGESKIGVVGSLGYACREELQTIGAEYGLEFVKFITSPICPLSEYHIAKSLDSETNNNNE